MRRTKIIGIGAQVPERVLHNKDLEKTVDTTDQWIYERTGIRERRIAAEGEVASDLSAAAALKAMKMAGITASDLDMIIIGTSTGDFITPSTACMVQQKLGVKNIACFDVAAGCTGFIYALSIADKFIKCGEGNNLLVIGCELLTKITNWEDGGTCILFGDGAGAVVLSATSEDKGILSTHLRSDGSHWDLLYMPGGGSANPATHETVDKKLHYLRMEGHKVFKVAVKAMEEIAFEALKVNKVTGSDIDFWIPHQANIRIVEAVAKKLKIPKEKTLVNIDRYGNTSAATIPIGLDEANREGRIKEGDLLLLNAFGAGFTWGSALIRL